MSLESTLADEIATAVNDAFKDLFSSATLRKETGVSEADYVAGVGYPSPSTSDTSCKAMVADFEDKYILEGSVKSGDRRVIVLRKGLSGTEINEGDQIIVDGLTVEVVHVSTDPAKAIYDCHAREV